MMFLTGVCVGVVLKILVPMPFLDDPVRNGYAKVVAWFGSFKSKG